MTTIWSEMLYKNKWQFKKTLDHKWKGWEEASDFKNSNLITAHEKWVINNELHEIELGKMIFKPAFQN